MAGDDSHANPIQINWIWWYGEILLLLVFFVTLWFPWGKGSWWSGHEGRDIVPIHSYAGSQLVVPLGILFLASFIRAKRLRKNLSIGGLALLAFLMWASLGGYREVGPLPAFAAFLWLALLLMFLMDKRVRPKKVVTIPKSLTDASSK